MSDKIDLKKDPGVPESSFSEPKSKLRSVSAGLIILVLVTLACVALVGFEAASDVAFARTAADKAITLIFTIVGAVVGYIYGARENA
jgi:hypothetical protein